MSTQLLLDNFLLKDIVQTLDYGISKDLRERLEVSIQENKHSWNPIPEGAIQIECLINFLIDIVTRDTLILDNQFSSAWTSEDNPLNILQKEGILSVQEINTRIPDFWDIRRLVLDKLCITDSLKEIQKHNEKLWAERRSVADNRVSILVWGTAGNLSRSNLVNAPYSPHPLRRQVIEQTAFRPPRIDATSETLKWIQHERITVFQELRNGMDFRAVQIVLPPIAVEIIESSTTIDDLIPVALQMRKEYSGFRKQMKKYQEALDDEDPKSIIRYREIFDSVHSEIFGNSQSGKYGESTISLGIGILNWQKTVPSLDKVFSKFGIRATLQNMVFQKKGEGSLKKLLSMFDEGKSRLGIEIFDYFRMQKGSK